RENRRFRTRVIPTPDEGVVSGIEAERAEPQSVGSLQESVTGRNLRRMWRRLTAAFVGLLVAACSDDGEKSSNDSPAGGQAGTASGGGWKQRKQRKRRNAADDWSARRRFGAHHRPRKVPDNRALRRLPTACRRPPGDRC